LTVSATVWMQGMPANAQSFMAGVQSLVEASCMDCHGAASKSKARADNRPACPMNVKMSGLHAARRLTF
jgi:hypothetical protein